MRDEERLDFEWLFRASYPSVARTAYLVVRDRDILGSPGLREVAEILFGDQAERRLADYVEGKALRH